MPPSPDDSIRAAQISLIEWTSEASHLICELFTAIGPHFNEKNFTDPNEGLPLWQLQTSCHTTSESALLLVRSVRLWDGDVLVRSAMEGSYKFAFLLIGSEEERKRKLHEFGEILFELADLKRSSRIAEMMGVLPDPNSVEWKPLRDLVLSPEREAELRSKYPREMRREIDRRWSFGEICAALKRSGAARMASLGHMMYSYGMSSHVAHQDAVGVGMVWDRIGRDDARRNAVELAHGSRLIGDVCVMASLRAHFLLGRCKEDATQLASFKRRLDALLEKMRPAMDAFSQIEYGAGPAP